MFMLAPSLTRVASRRLPALTQTRTRLYATPSSDAKDANAKDSKDAKDPPPTETGAGKPPPLLMFADTGMAVAAVLLAIGAGGYYFYANTNPVEVEARRASVHAHRAAELRILRAQQSQQLSRGAALEARNDAQRAQSKTSAA
ncbi:hypothetical protein CcaverHIS641_0208800 [Cutaneotrichosporon cavernicola]|nr:hypothetical protein CcaverHIS641_0208800 [Cutaneotrichosporon cavernicola]